MVLIHGMFSGDENIAVLLPHHLDTSLHVVTERDSDGRFLPPQQLGNGGAPCVGAPRLDCTGSFSEMPMRSSLLKTNNKSILLRNYIFKNISNFNK